MKKFQCDPSGQFTCNVGNCIDISLRCDNKEDCIDGSDEQSCTVVVLDQNKITNRYGPQTNETLKIAIGAKIREISDIDVQNLRFKLRFEVEMSWYETRVETYQHLVNDTMKNTIDPDVSKQLWIPKVRLTNSEEELPLRDVGVTSMAVKMMGSQRPAGFDNMHEARLFSPRTNPLVFQVALTAVFTCNFNLTFYPFDTQHCYAEVSQGTIFFFHCILVLHSVT